VKHSAEYNAFTKTVDRLLSLSKEEIVRREEEYRRLNPPTRGPKPKRKTVKPSASHGPVAG